ncbi:uncharacterized protein B0H18DRAFT_979589 [Fomitopsis serialis]|uniref:uncharacterized protein n=1 Tax=Fomitopsis serialis TaxID=139415 RepID=UPI0020075906|nr:uncharacterized protein B0H18DRAFT_979589 [Neoantrodia serialis]KAH9934129.1 hypothetical protein B0H18DRAFT_979589 [Neoantrodia serialis]
MAIDLLTDAYWNGRLKRLYRHDLESFVWVMVYYAWAFDDEGLEAMMTADYEQCCVEKAALLMNRTRQRPDNRTDESADDDPEYVPFLSRQLLGWLLSERMRRDTTEPRNPFTKNKQRAPKKKQLFPKGNLKPHQEAKRDFDSFWNNIEYIRKAVKDAKMTPEGVEYFKSREKKLKELKKLKAWRKWEEAERNRAAEAEEMERKRAKMEADTVAR